MPKITILGPNVGDIYKGIKEWSEEHKLTKISVAESMIDYYYEHQEGIALLRKRVPQKKKRLSWKEVKAEIRLYKDKSTEDIIKYTGYSKRQVETATYRAHTRVIEYIRETGSEDQKKIAKVCDVTGDVVKRVSEKLNGTRRIFKHEEVLYND